MRGAGEGPASSMSPVQGRCVRWDAVSMPDLLAVDDGGADRGVLVPGFGLT